MDSSGRVKVQSSGVRGSGVHSSGDLSSGVRGL